MFTRKLKQRLLQLVIIVLTSAILAQCGLRNQVDTPTVQEQSGAQATIVQQDMSPLEAPPRVELNDPTDGSEITSPTDIAGTVRSSSKASWMLDYRVKGDHNYSTFGTGDNSIFAEVEATFDPSSLFGGIYEIRLLAKDEFGQTAEATVEVLVTRGLEFAMSTLEFVDLVVLSRYPYHLTPYLRQPEQPPQRFWCGLFPRHPKWFL